MSAPIVSAKAVVLAFLISLPMVASVNAGIEAPAKFDGVSVTYARSVLPQRSIPRICFFFPNIPGCEKYRAR